jgi:hypothetical protein
LCIYSAPNGRRCLLSEEKHGVHHVSPTSVAGLYSFWCFTVRYSNVPTEEPTNSMLMQTLTKLELKEAGYDVG